MDKIFGSWWPFSWGRQETQTNFVSSTSTQPSTVELSTISTITSAPSTTRSTATISNAFYTLINVTLDIFNGTTIDPFIHSNDSLLETKDFTEDELFGMLWTNTTDLEFGRNSTNATSGTSVIKIETTWHLFSMIATAVILGFIILATVIGEFILLFF